MCIFKYFQDVNIMNYIAYTNGSNATISLRNIKLF